MALLNDIYIHVVSEERSSDVEVSSHSVETGIDITDTVKRRPYEVSLSGLIVDYLTGLKQVKAFDVISQIENLKNAGALIRYSGRCLCSNMQIVSFSTSHPNTVAGGAEFTMTLKECRIVKNAYVEPENNGGTKQVQKGDNEEVWYTVKKGDCVAALVAEPKAPYKNLKREGAKSGYWGACNWVMEKNQSAFSRKNDFRTLQIGKKILLGTREK